MTLTIKGELWQIVDATPPNVMYGSLRASGLTADQLIRKVSIKNNDPQPIKLATPTSTTPVFVTELKELEPGKSFELVITAKQPLPTGNTSGNIQINTGLKEMPLLNIPVSIYVTADVEATPAQLIVPLAIPKPMQRLIYVRNYVDKPMKITDVTVSNPDIKTQLAEPQTGVAWRITVDIPKDLRLSSTGEKITIKTDSQSVPTLTVPILQAGTTPGQPAARVAAPTPAMAAGKAPVVPSKVMGTGHQTPAPVNQTPPTKTPAKP